MTRNACVYAVVGLQSRVQCKEARCCQFGLPDNSFQVVFLFYQFNKLLRIFFLICSNIVAQ